MELDDRGEVLEASAGERRGVLLRLVFGTQTSSIVANTYKVRLRGIWRVLKQPHCGTRIVRCGCPNLLKKGVCVTLGPVAGAVHGWLSEAGGVLRFDCVTGEYTMVECYARTTLLCSWMTVLVGDPLYNPYKARVS